MSDIIIFEILQMGKILDRTLTFAFGADQNTTRRKRYWVIRNVFEITLDKVTTEFMIRGLFVHDKSVGKTKRWWNKSSPFMILADLFLHFECFSASRKCYCLIIGAERDRIFTGLNSQ